MLPTAEESGSAQGLDWRKLFAAGLILLLIPYIRDLELITIDLEYPGWENEIKEHLLRYLREIRPDLSNRQIVFGSVGKKSRGHKVALATYRGEKRPDRWVRAEELLEVIT